MNPQAECSSAMQVASLFISSGTSQCVCVQFHGPSQLPPSKRWRSRADDRRAVGLKGGGTPAVLDATAGLGADAFVLASLGCAVRLVERRFRSVC